jgi:ASC-1-like (ASCH) protein
MVKAHLVTISSKNTIINIINEYEKITVRVFKPIYNYIHVGHYIRFVHTEQKTRKQYISDVIVEFIHIYDNFQTLLEKENLINYDYKKEGEETYGVVAIGFKKKLIKK